MAVRHRREAGSAAAARECFRAAAVAFSGLVSSIDGPDWTRPALGVWDLRSLVGHASRALSTIEIYLGKPAGAAEVHDPAEYFVAVRSADRQAIARRGREAGEALGEDPAGALADLSERVQVLVDRTADDTTVGTPAGSMRLVDYLPTRTFELTVHSLDIARAAELPLPNGLREPIAECCALTGVVAGRVPEAPELLLLVTGRSSLTEGLSVV